MQPKDAKEATIFKFRWDIRYQRSLRETTQEQILGH